MTNHTIPPFQIDRKMQLTTLCSNSQLRLAATSPFFASAESPVCPQHAQQDAGHIQHLLVTGHERTADAGSAHNMQVLS